MNKVSPSDISEIQNVKIHENIFASGDYWNRTFIEKNCTLNFASSAHLRTSVRHFLPIAVHVQVETLQASAV